MPEPRPAFAYYLGLVALLAAGCGSPKPATPAYALPPPAPAERAPEQTPAYVEAEPIGPLSMDAAVARAVECSGEVAALRWSAYAARQQAYAEVQYRDPQLRGRYSEDELEETGIRTDFDPLESPSDVSRVQDGWAYGAGLRFYPRNPLVTYWSKREGNTAARAAEELVREAQWRIASEVRRLYVRVRYLEQDEVILGWQLEVCRMLREHARARHDQGQLLAQDMFGFARKHIESRSAWSRCNREVEIERRALAALLDLSPEDVDLSPDAAVGERRAPEDAQRHVETALHCRPDLAVLRFTTLAAGYGLSSAKSQRMPWIEYVQGSYGAGDADEVSGATDAPGGGDVTRSEIEQEEWRVDAALTLPVFSWGSRRPRQAEALMHAALENEKRLSDAIESEVRAALQDVQCAEDLLRESAADGEELLNEARELAKALEVSTSAMAEDLLQIQEDIFRIERVNLRHRYDVQATRVRLLEVMGVVTGDEVGE